MAVVIRANTGNNQRRRVGRRVLLFGNDESVEGEEAGLDLRSARAVLAAEKIVRAIVMRAFEKIRERRETCVAPAAVVESARAHEGELGAMEGEFIDLAMIKLEGLDKLRRGEERAAPVAQPAVRREGGMRGKPARERRRIDGVAVSRGQAAAGFLEGATAIVGRERVEDFVEGIGLVAQSARSGRESTVARLAAIEPDRFEFLGAAAPGRDGPAAAGRAALGRFDRRSGVRGPMLGCA